MGLERGVGKNDEEKWKKAPETPPEDCAPDPVTVPTEWWSGINGTKWFPRTRAMYSVLGPVPTTSPLPMYSASTQIIVYCFHTCASRVVPAMYGSMMLAWIRWSTSAKWVPSSRKAPLKEGCLLIQVPSDCGSVNMAREMTTLDQCLDQTIVPSRWSWACYKMSVVDGDFKILKPKPLDFCSVSLLSHFFATEIKLNLLLRHMTHGVTKLRIAMSFALSSVKRAKHWKVETSFLATCMTPIRELELTASVPIAMADVAQSHHAEGWGREQSPRESRAPCRALVSNLDSKPRPDNGRRV